MAVSRKTQKDVGKFEAKFIGPFTTTQTIFVVIGAVLALLVKFLMDAIGAPIEDMEYFYNESRGLTKVSPDSIQRFATKVVNYVTYYPETKSDPYYPEIVDNINDAAKLCGLTIHITLNPEWEGEIEYYF